MGTINTRMVAGNSGDLPRVSRKP